MNIVICDDNRVFSQELALELKSVFAQKGFYIHVINYQNPALLMRQVSEHVDAYFLDIEMPDINGIQLAEFLRKQRECEFVFVSVHDELWRSLMKVKPIAFVRKCCLKSDLQEAVDTLIREFKRKKKTIVVYDGKSAVPVRLNDVLYFSSDKDYVVIHDIMQKDRLIRQKLDNVQENVQNYDFLRIHRRYLVNMRHLIYLDPYSFRKTSYIELSDATRLPISEKYLENVKDRLFQWFERQDT